MIFGMTWRTSEAAMMDLRVWCDSSSGGQDERNTDISLLLSTTIHQPCASSSYKDPFKESRKSAGLDCDQSDLFSVHSTFFAAFATK